MPLPRSDRRLRYTFGRSLSERWGGAPADKARLFVAYLSAISRYSTELDELHRLRRSISRAIESPAYTFDQFSVLATMPGTNVAVRRVLRYLRDLLPLATALGRDALLLSTSGAVEPDGYAVLDVMLLAPLRERMARVPLAAQELVVAGEAGEGHLNAEQIAVLRLHFDADEGLLRDCTTPLKRILGAIGGFDAERCDCARPLPVT